MPRYGILLVNLGTPLSHRLKDVYTYLNQFLTDERVIDIPWLKRQLLVRGIIVPTRVSQSAKLYRTIWTQEGSPLLVHSVNLKNLLAEKLGTDFKVALGMRYQHPSILKGLEELQQSGVREILIFPLFPQYASATTGSVHQQVMSIVQKWPIIPKMTFINSFADHPAFIEALAERGKQYSLKTYDHILFSFHGLPERQIRKSDSCNHCFKAKCCSQITSSNYFCYKAQCHATMHALAQKLNLDPSQYTICFQSRLGKEPWITPFTSDVIKQRASQGDKRLLVFCPAFVCDCLETICEISHEYQGEFRQAGGKELQLVEGLNTHPAWIEAIKTLVLEQFPLH